MKIFFKVLSVFALIGLVMIMPSAAPEYKSGKITEKEGRYPNDWFYRQRSYPFPQMRSDLFYKALRQAKDMEAAGLKTGQPQWELVGPVNIGGRITDVEMPVNDKNTVFIAAASGGIFKSADQGNNWKPVFDDALALAVGDMDISKSDNNIIYAGTGEPNAGGGSHTYEGYGVYKSVDAGETWTHAGLNDAGSIGRVKIDPNHPDTVYVAAMGHLFAYNSERGIFRTRNGGRSWDKVLYLSDSTGGSDLCINPADSKILYASLWERTRRPPYQSYGGNTSGLWKSVNGGDTWTELTNGLPKGNVGRIGIDIADSNPAVLYATYTDSTGYLLGIYKTTTGGDSWTKTGELGENSSYWWWFSEVDVDPLNANVAYVSGFDVYKTGNGGTAWNRTFNSAHVDQHGLYIHPKDNALVLLGNDGGLYISKSGGANPYHIETLPITQFYTCEVDFKNPNRFYGGTQDNGTIRTTTGETDNWQSIYGGDGFFVKVDPTDNNYVYAEYQNGWLGRSIDGGASWLGATSGISGEDRSNWKSPLELDPSNPAILYFGTNKLYKSTNRAAQWRSISADLTKGPGVNVTYGTITTISASPVDGKIIYAGTDDGKVWNTLDGGTTWNDLSATLPDRWITCVQTDPRNKSTAYVTISGYRWDSYLTHVYRTRNNGQTWEPISGNLPDFPVNNITIDPGLDDTYYIGTDGGVFITRNGGQTWEVYGEGLPHAPVFDMVLHNPTRKLIAATFGRSMYRIDLPVSTGINTETMVQSPIAAYPNPFDTRINLTIGFDQSCSGELSVYNMTGRKIKVIHHGIFQSGENRFSWSGNDEENGNVIPGLYLIRLETGNTARTLRILKSR